MRKMFVDITVIVLSLYALIRVGRLLGFSAHDVLFILEAVIVFIAILRLAFGDI